MRISGQLLWQVCALTGLLCYLAGCALLPKERIASSTADYNLVVEKVQNQMLLLNIVRASKRRPMYFTGFNLLRGSMSYNFQTGDITIPFGKIGTGLNGAYSVVPGISYRCGPIICIRSAADAVETIRRDAHLGNIHRDRYLHPGICGGRVPSG